MATGATLAALMAAAAMAGALAVAIVFMGGDGPPASDPAGTGAAGHAADGGGAGDARPAGFGVAGGGAGDAQPDVRPPPADGGSGAGLAADGGGAGDAQPVQPEPPARTGSGGDRPPPAPGRDEPPGELVFYTKADLVEFVESGGAASPVAALAAKFPAGGGVVRIIAGGLADLDRSMRGAGQLDGWMPEGGRGAAPGAPVPEAPAVAGDGGGLGGGAAADVAEGAPFPDAAMSPAAAGDGAGSPAMPDANVAPPSPAHSTTNIQVEGVDEPDFVKNDARHIYILDGGELTIVDALPADTVRVLSGGSAGEVRDSYRPEDASVAFRGPIGPPGDYRYDNMFLDGDSLIVIYEARQWASVPLDPADPARTVAVRLPTTYVMWVDIADRSAPVPAGEYAVDGGYGTARVIDGIVYLVTRTGLDERGPPGLPGLWYNALEGRDPGLPCRGSPAAEGAAPQRAPACGTDPLVPPAHYLAPVERDPALTTVSALPPGGSDPAARTYLLGGDGIAYVSKNAAYLALPRTAPGPADVLDGLLGTGLLRAMADPIDAKWRQEALAEAVRPGQPAADRLEAALLAVQSGYAELEPDMRAAALQALDEEAWSRYHAIVPADPRTDVHRIELGGAPGGAPSLSHVGAGGVRGAPLDQFSMDEHGGMLRIATSVDDGHFLPHTAVHVLDAGSMAVSASLEGIAPGETMRSARFAGDTLFLVTFLEVDPFFVVDMSGPVPVVLGELKIPGFSTYLQPYGPDAVVGVGTYVSEGVDEPDRDWSVKVSLYDVSDYRRPLLADEAVIEGSAWSPAQSNHRALLADAEAGIVALPVVFDWGGPRPAAAAPAAGMPARGGEEGAIGWTGFYAFRTDASEPGLGEASAIRHGAASDGAPPEGRSLYIADWLYTIYDGVLAISSLDDPGRLVKSIDLGR